MPRSREGTYTFCVYGSSSPRTPPEYKAVSRKLGNLLADGGHMTVNGAGKSGCMGALNDGVTERCGRVRGVIHEMWIVDKSEHPRVQDLKVVGGYGLQPSKNDARPRKKQTHSGAGLNNSYQERKRVLTEDADCIIALPGGPGTWDELWEIVCLKGIGLSNLPICIIDVDDFYAGFRMQLKRAHADKLLYMDPDRLLHFESEPEAALQWCISELKGVRPGTRSTTFPAPRERLATGMNSKLVASKGGSGVSIKNVLALVTLTVAVSITGTLSWTQRRV